MATRKHNSTTAPRQMRYVHCVRSGEPSVMHLEEMPVPKPAPHEVRIKIHYAGINRPDLLQRAGHYPPPKDASPILGLECAGVIDAIGADIQDFDIGDAVCALLSGGGYAEYASVDARHVLPLPKGWSMRDAAALPEAVFTVWANIFDRAKLTAGEVLLVHGGTSGLGHIAVQMAQIFGAQAYATAGNSKKCKAIEEMGAIPLNYNTLSYDTHLRDLGIKPDVILNIIGGDYIQRDLSILNTEGRLILLAFQNGSHVEIDLMRLMLKRLWITGSTMRTRTPEYKAKIAETLYTTLWPKLAQGRLTPLIDRVFALDDVAQAHHYLASGAAIGKILLKI